MAELDDVRMRTLRSEVHAKLRKYQEQSGDMQLYIEEQTEFLRSTDPPSLPVPGRGLSPSHATTAAVRGAPRPLAGGLGYRTGTYLGNGAVVQGLAGYLEIVGERPRSGVGEVDLAPPMSGETPTSLPTVEPLSSSVENVNGSGQ